MIVTKHELGLPFPLGTFGTNPSTIFLVIVITDRQTDTHTQTNAGKTYSHAFAGRIIPLPTLSGSEGVITTKGGSIM